MYVNGLAGQYANQMMPLDRGALIFGRNAASCNVLFSDSTRGVSRMHCKVEQSAMGATITDLGSSYGTFLNGMKIQQYVPIPLKNGDSFYIGDKANLFSFQDPRAMAGQVGMAVQGGAPVTYLNSNYPNGKAKDTNYKIIIFIMGIVFVIAIGIVALIAKTKIDELENANSQTKIELEQEQNKSLVEEIFDVVDVWFD